VQWDVSGGVEGVVGVRWGGGGVGGGGGGGVWATFKGGVSGLGHESPWLELGRPFLLF